MNVKVESAEPWLIVRVPNVSAFIYKMPAGEDSKVWINEILMQILNVHKVEIKFNSAGKPCLPPGLGFANWSNSNGEYILAYSKECEIGIDLEFYRKRNFEAISKRFFAPSEIAGKAEEFYPLWTKKEAYYKCFGGNFFSVLKNDSYPNARIWNLQGPYRQKHELALCLENK